ncbi:hypothetical protein FRC11_006007 [Ceratobasidium sp. 423]|nr:hypothetical protein FRC11_006007 [Ceratobasidium sp. 423]
MPPKRPSTGGKTPRTSAKSPATGGKTPMTSAKSPATGGKTPRTSAKSPATGGKTPRTSAKSPATGGKVPAPSSVRLTEFVSKKRHSQGGRKAPLKIAPVRLQKVGVRVSNTATLVLVTGESADLLKGLTADETGDAVCAWPEEKNNGYPDDLGDDESLVRAINNFCLVDKEGFICEPDTLQFENCCLSQEVHLVGWVTPLTVGPRRFFRVVSGYWPPKDWCTEAEKEQNDQTVWRMNLSVMRVRIRKLFWDSMTIYGRTIEGVFATAWNNKVEYWLQHPAPEYAKLFERLRIKNTEIRKRQFKDLDPSKPNDGTMHPWTLSMLRLEENFYPHHPDDKPFEYAGDCDEDSICYISDASSISTDDDKPYPTGLSWRAHTYGGGRDLTMGEADGSDSASEDGADKGQQDTGGEMTDNDAEGEDEPVRPEKRVRIAEPAQSPPAPAPESSSDEERTPVLKPPVLKSPAKGKGNANSAATKPRSVGPSTSVGVKSKGSGSAPLVPTPDARPRLPRVDPPPAHQPIVPPEAAPDATLPPPTTAPVLPAPALAPGPDMRPASTAPTPSPAPSIDPTPRPPPRRNQDQLDLF